MCRYESHYNSQNTEVDIALSVKRNMLIRIATALSVAIVVFSCKSKMGQTEGLDLDAAPLQSIDDMFAVDTKNGKVTMRIEADKMLHFDQDSMSRDFFPNGFELYGYNDEGLLETLILSDQAQHITYKKDNSELWEAFGNVVIHNVIKQETAETDTIYWDKGKNEIYTDCYVKMYSPTGFMQGYGMRSDDRARNSILMNPFNGYVYTKQDSTAVVIDSVNFIGPFPKKR